MRGIPPALAAELESAAMRVVEAMEHSCETGRWETVEGSRSDGREASRPSAERTSLTHQRSEAVAFGAQ